MVDVMEIELPEFGGSKCRVRCLDHIINLVAKALTRIFDAKHERGDSMNSQLNALMDGMDVEELETRLAAYKAGQADADLDDNVDFIDLLEGLNAEQLSEVRDTIRPAQIVIAKVSDLLCCLDTVLHSYIRF